MEMYITYAGKTGNRLFGKAVRRARQGLVGFFSELNRLLHSVPANQPEDVVELVICDGHSLEYWHEDVGDHHIIVTLGIAPGLSFAKKDDLNFAAFLIERVRFYLQHKGLMTPELADFLEAQIQRTRESAT